MHQTRHRHVRILATGISHIVRRGPRLFDPRNDLAPDRIARIFFSRDQIEKVRCDGEGEFVTGKQNSRSVPLR